MLVAETLGEFAVAFQAPVVENDRNVMVDDGRVRLLDDQGTVKAPGNLFPGPVVGVVPVCAGMGNIERALLQPRGVGQRSEQHSRQQAAPSNPKRYQSVPSCPQCGSVMRRRSGRYGSFWGCSRYPSCRGARNI